MNDLISTFNVNNRTQTLKKHVIIDQGEIIGYKSDLIFKQNDYIHTYIVINTSGIPNGILTLVDENKKPLYSPYTVNRSQQRTLCQINLNNENAIPLPANYINENNYTHFAGTKYWKLYYHDPNGIYMDKYIDLPPITIENFDIWNVTTPIYPNEDLQVTIRTYINTIEPDFNYMDSTTRKIFVPDNNGKIIFTELTDQLTIGNHSYTLWKNGDSTKTKNLQYTVQYLPYYLLNVTLNNNQDIETTYIALNRINNDDLISNIAFNNDKDLIITKTNISNMSDPNINNIIQSIEFNNKDLTIIK